MENLGALEMSKNTPGPWALRETKHPSCISSWDIVCGDDRVGLFPYKRYCSADGVEGGLVIDDERMANARLMASAPELLKALKTFVADWSNDTGMSSPSYESVRFARDAIAKAEGLE